MLVLSNVAVTNEVRHMSLNEKCRMDWALAENTSDENWVVCGRFEALLQLWLESPFDSRAAQGQPRYAIFLGPKVNLMGMS
jgi:hypothetical protein